MLRTFRVAGLGFSLLLVLLVGACTDRDTRREDPASPPTADIRSHEPAFGIRSVTLDARRQPEPELLRTLRDLGVTHLTLVPFGWQRSADDPHIRVDTSAGWYSESHQGIRTLARQADGLGMDIIIKPHIWIGGYDGTQDRSEIRFASESRWTTWERNYRDFLLTYAQLAADVEAEILVLGTELRSVATRRPSFWRRLAGAVREVYGGELTYAANWHDEYEDVQFWDALDYVGVQAYFPLAKGEQSSYDSLKSRWRRHRASLKSVHERTGQPVLFTEIGYRSARTAAAAPWRWPENGKGVPPDSALQARCYRAFLSTMNQIPWFAGAVIWKWHPASRQQEATAFTPQGKPAERVLYRWFTGTLPQVPLRGEGDARMPSSADS